MNRYIKGCTPEKYLPRYIHIQDTTQELLSLYSTEQREPTQMKSTPKKRNVHSHSH